MDFIKAINMVKNVLDATNTEIEVGNYDGLIVKKLVDSNTLDSGRTTNQTHIAITGKQMDIFPYLCADGYFCKENEIVGVDLKKYFVISIPVIIFESNCRYLGYNGDGFNNGVLKTSTCVVRSKRVAQGDQLQVSMLALDDPGFVDFRRMLHAGSYFILLKCKGQMKYHAFGVEENLGDKDLSSLNNQFFKDNTNTVVNAECFNSYNKEIICDEIEENLSIEDLGDILSNMYNGGDSTGIRMFGVKYGKVIIDNKYSIAEIIKAAKISKSYDAEVSKGINIYKAIKENLYGIKFYEEEQRKDDFPKLSPRENKKFPLNCILYGAPGTGKTYATAQYALAIVEDKDLADIQKEIRSEVMSRYNSYRSKGQIVFTTFHQNYGYEDFIQGVRPDTSNKDLSFKTVNGVFKTIAENAIHDPQNNYIIVIDEINRANISKVFGELITLIEEDKRWGEENAISVTLPSGDVFAVPNNLYIIGTMNSADKSISLIDSALRRRFNFIEFTPNSNLVEDGKLKTVLETLNDGLRQELQSTDLLIGHSYFMNKDINDLEDIMNQNIIPLLYEYFFDNEKKVEAQIRNAIEGMNVDIQVGKMGRIKIIKKDNKDA